MHQNYNLFILCNTCNSLANKCHAFTDVSTNICKLIVNRIYLSIDSDKDYIMCHSRTKSRERQDFQTHETKQKDFQTGETKQNEMISNKNIF